MQVVEFFQREVEQLEEKLAELGGQGEEGQSRGQDPGGGEEGGGGRVKDISWCHLLTL